VRVSKKPKVDVRIAKISVHRQSVIANAVSCVPTHIFLTVYTLHAMPVLRLLFTNQISVADHKSVGKLI